VRIDPGSNAALFLQLGLPSTIIRHKNRAFKKALFKREEAENETPAFHFCSDGKKIWKQSFWKRWRHDNHVISPAEFSSNTNPTWQVIFFDFFFCVFKFLRRSVDEVQNVKDATVFKMQLEIKINTHVKLELDIDVKRK